MSHRRHGLAGVQFVLGILISVAIAMHHGRAQTALGTITGVVKDPSGAVIPGARMQVINDETGMVVAVQSQADGTYLAPSLVPGEYRIVVELEGFKRYEARGLRLNVGSTLTHPVVLEVGVVTEQVQVSGQALMVETTSGQVGHTVQVEQILEMPNQDRNVYNLVNLTPGAFMQGGEVSVGGSRTQSTAQQLDGVQSSRAGLGANQMDLAPPIDAVREFKVEVNAMGAEYGRSSGGVLNAVTRSGTNEFRGALYEFVRNDGFDARGWAADVKPTLRRNNFGGSLGGPIRKNKTFFFYNLDLLRDHTVSVRTRSVGLPEFQQGDFSRATALVGGQVRVVPIYDPATGTGTFAEPRATQPFPGNVIPKSRWDPVATRIIEGRYIPAPNRPPNNVYNNSGNWQQNALSAEHRNYHTIRLDHELSTSTRAYARFLFTEPDDSLDHASEGYGPADPDQLYLWNNRYNLALNVTHLFSPTLFLSSTLGFNRLTIHRGSGACCDTNWAEKFGIPVLAKVAGEAFPRLNFGGGLVPVNAIGATGDANRFAAFNNFDYDFQFTRVGGKHTLKFGFKHQRFQGNDNNRRQPSGTWAFTERFTRGYDAQGKAIANTGIRFAEFLLGRLNSVSVNLEPMLGKRIRYYAGYLQDDIRLTPRLTINLGVRYETETPASEVGGRMNGFSPYKPNPLAGQGDIPPWATGIVTFPSRFGYGKYLWRWDKNNIAPRFGFAWRLGRKENTVLRGGFGLFYAEPYSRNVQQVARMSFEQSYEGRHPLPFTLAQGIPAGALDPIPESERTPTFGMRGTRFATSTVQFFDEARVVGYSLDCNLTLQHQWRSWLFEVGALAKLGRHVPFANINLNHIRPEDLPKLETTPQLLLRPWPIFDSDMPQIQVMSPNWGISNAYLGTFRAERRFRDGFGLVLAYTFTSWIDNVIFVGDDTTFGDNDQIQNIYCLACERSRSTNSVPHRLVFGPIWDLPVGRGRMMGRSWHPVLDGIAGGWQFSMLGTIRSGAPFGVTVLNGPLEIRGDAADGTQLRPNLVKDARIYDARKGQPLEGGNRGIYWLTPDAFYLPERYHLGNASRTLPGVLGPGAIDLDLMLAKNWRFREHYRLQFRWEAYNFINHPNWNLPGQSVGDSGFGWITGASGRRIMQFGLKLYF